VLTASGLGKAHGDRVLFSDVTFRLAPGRRVALVGGNGTGKTTLLEILLGIQDADAGQVHIPKGRRLGYLPQDLSAASDGLVLDEVISGATHITELKDELERLEHDLATATGPDHDRAITAYGDAQAHFEQLGGYAIESEAHRVLAGLGFAPDDASRRVKELSGGWRMRVALARLLLAAPDVLLLDEPTNHLDIDSVSWLENHLRSYPGAVFFVSHDRDFIDAIAERVIELAGGTATEYVGGFAEFVVAREERIAQLEAAAAARSREVARVERFIDRFRYKASKARQVQSRIKTLEKLDAIEVPKKAELVRRFSFPEPRRSSRTVVEMENVSAGYDDELVVADVNLVVERGQKIALVGPNGAGKTTLLRVLLGELAPFGGTVTVGNNVDVSVFAQHQAEVLVPQRTVLQEFQSGIEEPGKRNLRTILGSFGFSGDAADQRVAELSGGEQTRLSIAKALVDPVNLLVLDEPTNHLDLPSCDVLEDALIAYPGTVLLVTHDRHLIRSVADALLDVRDGRARWYDGVPDEVLTPANDTTSRRPAGSKPTASVTANATPRTTSKSANKAERRRASAHERTQKSDSTKSLRKAVATAERAWEKAEATVAELQQQLADPSIYDEPEKVLDIARRHEAAKELAATRMAEWEAASEALDGRS